MIGEQTNLCGGSHSIRSASIISSRSLLSVYEHKESELEQTIQEETRALTEQQEKLDEAQALVLQLQTDCETAKVRRDISAGRVRMSRRVLICDPVPSDVRDTFD
jgi:hypothetical protein